MYKFKIDLEGEKRSFPHYWEMSVGSCHAATLLRNDVQQHIRKAHRDIGFKYLRFHGLFDDDMSVVIPPFMPGLGENRISFFNIDRVFDFLIETGMKPFVELSFMPLAMAKGSQMGFRYNNNVTMPKADEEWEDLIDKFTRHCIDRYGINEVRTWYFEVWNEPNLRFFFDGTMEDYFHLYEITSRSIKKVDTRLKVGGPATSNNMWIPEFKKFCEDNGVGYDFITTHHYPIDDPLSRAGMNGSGTKGQGIDPDMAEKVKQMSLEELEQFKSAFSNRHTDNPRDILYTLTKKAKAEAGDTPLIYTEWNVGHFDESYSAAGIMQTLSYNEGLVEGYSYWCVSDIFEEMGLNGLPFNNEFGLMNVYGIPKPSYRLFETLHKAGAERLSVDTIGDVSRTAEVTVLTDGSMVYLFAYNHDIEEREISDEELEITLSGSIKEIRKAVIDDENTAPLKVWNNQGRPEYPTKRELAEIEAASELNFERLPNDEAAKKTLRFTAKKESVTIFEITLI